MPPPIGPPAPASLWEWFARKAEQLGAVVVHAPSEAAALELLVRSSGETPPSCTSWLSRRFAQVAARCAPLPERGATSQVVAVGAFAVAETGSVLLVEDTRDRGACFLADHLWLLLDATDVVSTLDTALARLRTLIGAGAHHVVIVSGPSRTADIERTLTIGVHGPVRLTIVVVGEGREEATA